MTVNPELVLWAVEVAMGKKTVDTCVFICAEQNVFKENYRQNIQLVQTYVIIVVIEPAG